MKEIYCTFEVDGVPHDLTITDAGVTLSNDGGLDLELPGESAGEKCKAFKDYLMQLITSVRSSGREPN